MNPDVEAVVTELDAHRTRFEAFCRSLSAEELERPVPNSTWLARDFIAHLATIDGPVGAMFASVHAGAEPGIRTRDGGRWNVDEWNEKQIQERRSRDLEDVLAEAAEARAVLKEHLWALTRADSARTIKFAGDARRPAAQFPLGAYLRGWCKHDPMHAVDMARAFPEKVTPELQQWFDDPVIAGYQRAMNPA